MAESIFLQFGDSSFGVESDESLLDAASRAGINIHHSCRSGVCQTCLVKVSEGDIPKAAQHGLSENQKQQNFALACQLIPHALLKVQPLDHVAQHDAQVFSHSLFANNVLCLRLKADVAWRPGQFISVWKDQQLSRPYSIASLPEEDFLELHIKLHDKGEVSRWLHDTIKAGDTVKISDPRGNCFYSLGHEEKPLLLAGTGTGLAPLYGIARQALANGHKESIYLYFGGRNSAALYLVDELQTLAGQYPNFHFIPIVKEDSASDFSRGELLDTIKAQHTKLQNWCVFLCGAPDLVRKMQKTCFLMGASMNDILADPFISS